MTMQIISINTIADHLDFFQAWSAEPINPRIEKRIGLYKAAHSRRPRPPDGPVRKA